MDKPQTLIGKKRHIAQYGDNKLQHKLYIRKSVSTKREFRYLKLEPPFNSEKDSWLKNYFCPVANVCLCPSSFLLSLPSLHKVKAAV